MLKFFRKYNKIILVIGGSLLMVAFLVPQALQRIGKSAAGRAVVKFDGGSFSQMDIQRAANELVAVESLMGVPKDSFGVENEEHWLLLTTEARNAGFRGGPSDAEALINQVALTYAQQYAQQFQGQVSVDQAYAQARDALLQRRAQLVGGGSTTVVDSALSDLFAIQRLRSSYFAAPKLGATRAVRFADRILDVARVQASIVPAESLLAEMPQPSTAELEAQFAAYRDTDLGQGEYGFGYRQPVGVKVEWLTLNPAAIADAVTLDPINVRKRFESRRDLYPGEYAEERDNVRAELTREKVDQILTDAEQEIRGRGLDDVSDYPDSNGFVDLPEGWRDQRTPLETIAQGVVDRIREKHGVEVEYPFVGIENDGWISASEFRRLPGIGRSFVRDGLRTVVLADALDQIREVMPANTETPPRFQVGVLDRPSIDNAGQRHYFRFLDARRAGPPASIEEVRDAVSRDLRRLRAYDLLVERAEDAGDALVARGPKAAANTLDPTVGELVISVSDERAAPVGNPFAGDLVTRVLAEDSFRAPVMEAARRLDPLQPMDVQPLADRSLTVPVREALAVVFVRIVGRDPLTREEYKELQPQIVAAALQEELAGTGGAGGAGGVNPFSFEGIKQRLHYEDVSRRSRREAKNDDDELFVDQDASEPARPAAE